MRMLHTPEITDTTGVKYICRWKEQNQAGCEGVGNGRNASAVWTTLKRSSLVGRVGVKVGTRLCMLHSIMATLNLPAVLKWTVEKHDETKEIGMEEVRVRPLWQVHCEKNAFVHHPNSLKPCCSPVAKNPAFSGTTYGSRNAIDLKWKKLK